jgi:hypothetical protein
MLGKRLLADAYYCSFGNMAMLIRQGRSLHIPCKSGVELVRQGGRRGDWDGHGQAVLA